MKMNADILNVLIAVKAYKYFRYADSVARNMTVGDVQSEQFKYYCSLPLPNGMKKNNEHFKCVLSIIDDWKFFNRLLSCEEDELSKYDFLRSDLK